ncbi:MAG TPA: hypothetical protein V6D19_16980 [Stenomitos sp.]
MKERVLIVLLSFVCVVVLLIAPAISATSRAATVVPLEYKYITVSASATKATILSKLNTEGLNGWEVASPVECDDISCTVNRFLLKRPK